MAMVETNVPASSKRTEQHLVFRLAGEEYGFSVLKIEEIVQWVELTRVPRVPNFILGVMNLRGKVVPVAAVSRDGAYVRDCASGAEGNGTVGHRRGGG